MKEEIEKSIKKTLNKLGINSCEKITLEHPDILKHGDYSCNIAMHLSKQMKQNPKDLALHIIEKIDKNEYIEKIKMAGPGFINFYLSKKFYLEFLNNFKISNLELLKGKFFLAEHTDPNLFKEFHIGHVMTNTIGESMGRIAEYSGASVKHVTFQGDVGLHVAKTIWGIKNSKKDKPSEDDDIFTKQAYLGNCYVLGEKNYADDNFKKEIIEINKKVYSREDEDQNKIYEIGKKWSLDYFDYIYKMLGSNFDHYFLESSTFEIGKKIVLENIGNIFKNSRGAVIFPGSLYNLHDRVFINSENLPTYEAKDIGLFHEKWKKYNPDISMTVTSKEQKQYFEVVQKAAGMLNPEWAEKTVHLSHGELKLPRGKMSSRKGDIVRAKNWIDNWSEKVLEKMKDDDIINKKNIAKKIAIAAIKYQILKTSVGKDIIYDENKALDFSGNSGPYLQYAYVRAYSILKKSDFSKSFTNKERNGPIQDLEKILYRFNEEVEKSLNDYSPHYVANYLYKLSSEFNSFYAKNKFLDKKNIDYEYNLSLIHSFSKTLDKGLDILGIDTVPNM